MKREGLAVIGNLGWIDRQRARFEAQPDQSAHEMVSGESHCFLGRRYHLRVIEGDGPATVALRSNSTLELHVRPGTGAGLRRHILQEWYRQQLKELVPPLIDKWQTALGVAVAKWEIRNMKFSWGNCNIETHHLWLNVKLAKTPVRCLEYFIAHELMQMIEQKPQPPLHFNSRKAPAALAA